MTIDLPEPGRRMTELWTFVAVDPLAKPLSIRLARLPLVTPNRLTFIALTLGIAAAYCFATGRLRTGGLLFVLRFFADCLDGRVARLQGTASSRGASFDLGADVLGVTTCFAALGWYLVEAGHLGMPWLLAVLSALGLYNWELSQRKTLAASVGLGTGGASHHWRPRWLPLRRWVGFCDRRGVSAVPWAVECEIATLGLAPMLLPTPALGVAIIAALAFYVVADVLNAHRIWRIAARIDRTEVTP